MKLTVVAGVLVAAMVSACGQEANMAEPAPQPAAPVSTHVVNGIDFGNPEAVVLAYMNAGDRGDGETMKLCLRQSQRATFMGGSVGLPEPRVHQIVGRERRSASEVCLTVKTGDSSFTKPHVLVLEDGKWFVDFRKSLDAMMSRPPEHSGNPPPRPASKAGTR